MKIPTANPAREVQSLGRRDPGRELRVANIHAKAAEYEGAGLRALGASLQDVAAIVDEANDQREVTEYNAAIGQAQVALDGLAGKLKTQRRLNVNENPGLGAIDWDKQETVRGPDGAPIQRARESVPTDEVALQLFQYEAEQIRATARAGIKGSRAQAKFDTEWAKAHQSALLGVTTKTVELRKDREAIKLEGTIDLFIQTGQYERAHEALAHGVYTGVWTPERATSLRRRVDERIAANTALVALESARTEDDFEQFQQDVLNTPQLSPTDKAKFINQAEDRAAKLRTESERQSKVAADVAVSRSLEQHLTEGMTWEEASAQASRLRRMGQGAAATQLLKNYDLVRRRFIEESRESEPSSVRSLQRDIALVGFPPEGSSVQEEAARVRRQLVDALTEGTINDTDYRTLDLSLRGMAELQYDRESYRAAKRSVWTDVAGMSSDEFELALLEAKRTNAEDYSRLSAVRQLAARAEENMRAYVEATGTSADPELWWAKNRERYDVSTYLTQRRTSFLQQFPSYAPEGLDPNTSEGEAEVRRSILSDASIGRAEQQRRWALFSGARDRPEVE